MSSVSRQMASSTAADQAPPARGAIATPLRRTGAPSLIESLLVWALGGAMLAAIFVTYARVPAADLYHVGHQGVTGGASRALIALNFPLAIVALPLLGITAARLLAQPWAAGLRRWGVIAASLVALVLCAITAWPGVVTEDAFDARPVNALPTIGVGIVVALTALTVRVCGIGRASRLTRWDGARMATAAVLVLAGLPWFFADLGFYISDVPVTGSVFVARDLLPAGGTEAAVHLGHHHGADGVLFAVSALLLSRTLGLIGGPWLRALLCFAVVLMFVYGAALVANDVWGEQVVKRGWTSVGIPSVLWPAVTPAWGVVLAVTMVLYVLMMRGLHRIPGGAAHAIDRSSAS